MDGAAIASMVNGVTKTWAKKKKAEERSSRPPRAYYYSTRVTIKEAAYAVMADAYAKASADGKFYANARQIMYAARGAILERCDSEQLDDVYFTQTLLPNYRNEHPTETADWKIAYDNRGSFQEPHGGRLVGLGTIDVAKHLQSVADHSPDNHYRAVAADADSEFETCGPGDRYGAILFVEKEGFSALLKDSGIVSEFDLALMSTKGQTVTASRTLVEELSGRRGLPLFVLHDFDVAGFNIAAMFGRSNRRFQWSAKPNAIDLGLRFGDVNEWELQSEPVGVRSHDRRSLRRDGATEEEIEFLCGGRRVELNAFTSDQLVAWLRKKLVDAGVKKVVPETETLESAYRRAVHAQHVATRLEELDLDAEGSAAGAAAELPKDLADRVSRLLKRSPRMTWDAAVVTVAAHAGTEDE